MKRTMDRCGEIIDRCIDVKIELKERIKGTNGTARISLSKSHAESFLNLLTYHSVARVPCSKTLMSAKRSLGETASSAVGNEYQYFGDGQEALVGLRRSRHLHLYFANGPLINDY